MAKDRTIKNTVRVWNNNRITWEQDFDTAEEAHKEFEAIVDNWENHGVPNKTITVTRYRQWETDDHEMLMVLKDVTAK